MTDLLVPPDEIERLTRERPILFQGDMVRAILSGSKTQTRRIVKPQPDTRPGMECTRLIFKDRKGNLLLDEALEAADPLYRMFCPYGKPGDRLWVRETWAHGIHAMAAKRDEDGPFVYAATNREHQRLDDRWRPSIHIMQINHLPPSRLDGLLNRATILCGFQNLP